MGTASVCNRGRFLPGITPRLGSWSGTRGEGDFRFRTCRTGKMAAFCSPAGREKNRDREEDTG